METLPSVINWLNNQEEEMLKLLMTWAEINSGSENLAGLSKMLKTLKKSFSSLGGEISEIILPSQKKIDSTGKLQTLAVGKALRITCRQNSPFKIFLNGHMDTVYPSTHPFQKTKRIGNILEGPGVADMKGGLVVMLKALEALERHPDSKKIGWEVLITPDEEIGSQGSEALLLERAKVHDIGLIFEPTYPDGALVSERKGSANMTIVVEGKSAHAGRDFDKGASAIVALAKFIIKAQDLSDKIKGTTINIGQVIGGGPVNIVPDLAICRLNIRTADFNELKRIQQVLEDFLEAESGQGIRGRLYVDQIRQPKTFDEKSKNLFKLINESANQEGYDLIYRPSGGVCDGNILSSVGLPVIDTLGVIGGNIHTQSEYMVIESLLAKCRLVSRFLISLCSKT